MNIKDVNNFLPVYLMACQQSRHSFPSSYVFFLMRKKKQFEGRVKVAKTVPMQCSVCVQRDHSACNLSMFKKVNP